MEYQLTLYKLKTILNVNIFIRRNILIKLYTVAIIFALAIVGCTSSQFATYRPAGSTEANWEINVYRTSGVTNNFKVVINDSTVIDKNTGLFSGSLEEKGSYKGKDVKLKGNEVPSNA